MAFDPPTITALALLIGAVAKLVQAIAALCHGDAQKSPSDKKRGEDSSQDVKRA